MLQAVDVFLGTNNTIVRVVDQQPRLSQLPFLDGQDVILLYLLGKAVTIRDEKLTRRRRHYLSALRILRN